LFSAADSFVFKRDGFAGHGKAEKPKYYCYIKEKI